MRDQIIATLNEIVHPETGKGLAESGLIEDIATSEEGIRVTLAFPKARDPFANSIKRQVIGNIAAIFPEMKDRISVIVKEGSAAKTHPEASKPEQADGMSKVKKIIAVSSAKGGVGKSTVAVNLAITLASMGYATGILDADVYGPSLPKMLGLEGYLPAAEERDGQTYMIPGEAYGVKAMSIGFFINPDDALVWRGPMATGALKQLIHQTQWGELDMLVVDLPPGTGDVHLTILNEMKITGAVIVTTPQEIALADVVRGIAMFRAQQIEVPVLGLIENMAWFTPEEFPGKKYYIFGEGGAARLTEKTGVELIGQIPLIMPSGGRTDGEKPSVTTSAQAAVCYEQAARAIVNNLQ